MTNQDKPIITVFAGSRLPASDIIIDAAEELGVQIGLNGFNLIIGGNVGLMEIVAKASNDNGSAVKIVTLEKYAKTEIVPDKYEQIIKPDGNSRYHAMTDSSSGTLILPGGPGSLAEGIQALNDVIYCDKKRKNPVTLIDINDGCLSGIQIYFQNAVAMGFIDKNKREALRLLTYKDNKVFLDSNGVQCNPLEIYRVSDPKL